MFPRSLLGEFLEIFGKENTTKLIDVFSGTTLEIPSRKKLEILERDIQIYDSLCSCTSQKQTRKMKKRLACKHGLTEKHVRDIFKRLERQLKENRRFKIADDRTGRLVGSRLKVPHERIRW